MSHSSSTVFEVLYQHYVHISYDRLVRKAIRNEGLFQSDEAATKLIYLTQKNIMAKWERPPKA